MLAPPLARMVTVDLVIQSLAGLCEVAKEDNSVGRLLTASAGFIAQLPM
jgi:hypothetical protein